MPSLTRWFVRTSLLYLVLASLMGILIAARLPIVPTGLTPVYLHLFIVGWLTQLIFGVMHWMFPKDTNDKPRGDEGLVWAVFVMLNVGLVLRAVAEPLNARDDSQFWGTALALSALLQWLAGLGFVVNSWRRVKGR